MDKKINPGPNAIGEAVQPSRVNLIGLIGVILAAMAIAIGLFSTNIIGALESRKVRDKQYEPGDVAILTDKVGNVVTFGEQAVVFLARGLACGMLATIAFVLGCVALVEPPRIYGIIAVFLSFATFMAMLLSLVI